LHRLDGAEVQLSGVSGLSVSDQAVCVISDYKPICLSPTTLSEMWRWTSGESVVQDGTRVFLQRRGDTMSLRISDGSVIWMTGLELLDIKPTVYGLLSHHYNGQFDLRDPETGFVRRSWPGIRLGGVAVHGNLAAVADWDVLWLIDLAGNPLPH